MRDCYCCVAEWTNENCVDLWDINLDFHDSQGGSQECCKMPTSTLPPILSFSLSQWWNNVELNFFCINTFEWKYFWCHSSIFLGGVGVGEIWTVKNKREKHFQIRFLRWCDVLFDVVKSMQKLFTTKRCDAIRCIVRGWRWIPWMMGELQDTHCGVSSTFSTHHNSRVDLDKIVLMFHSGFANTCQSTRFLLMDNSSSRFMKLFVAFGDSMIGKASWRES